MQFVQVHGWQDTNHLNFRILASVNSILRCVCILTTIYSKMQPGSNEDCLIRKRIPDLFKCFQKKSLVELGALIGNKLTFMLNEIESKEWQQKSSNLSRRPQLNQGIDQSFRRRLPAHIAQAFAARPGLLIAVLQRSVKPDANQKLTQKNGHCH